MSLSIEWMDSVEVGQIAGFSVLGLVILSGCVFLWRDVFGSCKREAEENLKQEHLLDIEEWK
jgi:hypothetical protein